MAGLVSRAIGFRLRASGSAGYPPRAASRTVHLLACTPNQQLVRLANHPPTHAAPLTALGFALRRAVCTAAPRDPYATLGVTRSASDATIKQAYFRLAKANHPDLNKSPEAPRRFREVAEAYEQVRDAASRRAYESSGSHTGARQRYHHHHHHQQQQQHQQHQHQHQQSSSSRWQQRAQHQQGRWQQQQWQQQRHSEDVFRRVWSELGMAEIDAYIARVQLEAGRALRLATTGDTSLAWQFAKEHRALLIGTIGPALLVLRVPAAAVWSVRLASALVFLARLGMPINMQWYLLSRLWVRAVLHMERVAAVLLPKPGTGSGKGAGASKRRR